MISTPDLRERARRRVIRALCRLHVMILRVGRGWVLGRIAGMPVLLLTTTGRRSGKRRTVPLTYLRDGEDLAIVASFGGSDQAPSWLLNLQHDSSASVQLDRVTVAVTARTADAGEQARLWPTVVGTYPGYARYQARTHRPIPIVLLTPTGDHDPGR